MDSTCTPPAWGNAFGYQPANYFCTMMMSTSFLNFQMSGYLARSCIANNIQSFTMAPIVTDSGPFFLQRETLQTDCAGPAISVEVIPLDTCLPSSWTSMNYNRPYIMISKVVAVMEVAVYAYYDSLCSTGAMGVQLITLTQSNCDMGVNMVHGMRFSVTSSPFTPPSNVEYVVDE